MNKYRLKPEAVPFFKKDIATSIYDYQTWTDLHVDPNALEELEDTYITYGHENIDRSSSVLSGWDGKNGQRFHFSIIFPSVKFSEADKFGNGKMVRELMNKIQSAINNFYGDFIEKEASHV